ncbi:unnamed protein product [Rhizophagus irregularis]|nr:unnamed protein product [Rhizophagus irregularis]
MAYGIKELLTTGVVLEGPARGILEVMTPLLRHLIASQPLLSKESFQNLLVDYKWIDRVEYLSGFSKPSHLRMRGLRSSLTQPGSFCDESFIGRCGRLESSAILLSFLRLSPGDANLPLLTLIVLKTKYLFPV